MIEGAYARAGLVSDIEVVDDYPSHMSALQPAQTPLGARRLANSFSGCCRACRISSGRVVRNPLVRDFALEDFGQSAPQPDGNSNVCYAA